MRYGVLLSVLLGAAVSASVAEAGPHQHLLDTISSDDSYKVRMQAIRVLVKRLSTAEAAPEDDVIEALGLAATRDENRLVRGFACAGLGSVADQRARPYLARAVRDPEPFVQAQAEDALKKLPSAPRPPDTGTRPMIVLETAKTPGVISTPELDAHLGALIEQGIRDQAAGRFELGSDARREGFHLRSSIGTLQITPQASGKKQITVVVSLTIATWPRKALRHALTAKASTVAKAEGKELVALQKLLLEAAAKKVVKDSMAEISGG